MGFSFNLHVARWGRKTPAMGYKVFIDGEAGTTGLQVRERLNAHPSVELISVDEALRKDKKTRLEAMASADAAILCLPDEAAMEAVKLADGLKVKIIDSSTAFRCHKDWVYGFPELTSGQRQKIAASSRVANVGCYASAMIALIRPLIENNMISPETPLNISAISGYSGGGRGLIEHMKGDEGAKHFAYALGLNHKHIPEVMMHSGLTCKPSFVPMVGDFACGMLVQMPLIDGQLKASRADLHDAYTAYYQGERLIKICALDSNDGLTPEGYLPADALKGKNNLEIHVLGNDAQALVVARLDNLGKGAAGSAVQNLNLMLGIDETESLL